MMYNKALVFLAAVKFSDIVYYLIVRFSYKISL